MIVTDVRREVDFWNGDWPLHEELGMNTLNMACRSLMAAYEAVCLGVRNIRVLKGGFAEWKRNGR